MTSTIATLPILAAVAFASVPWPNSVTVMKCGTAENPLVAVDGRIEDISPNDVERKDLLWLEIVCMDPVDSTLSLDPGIPVISIWTVHGPAPQMELALTKILEVQSSHRESTGTYLKELDQIDLSDFSAEVHLAMRVTERGWIAAATVDNFLTLCFVRDGEIDTPFASIGVGEATYLSRDSAPGALAMFFPGMARPKLRS